MCFYILVQVIVLTERGEAILAQSWDLSDSVNRTIFADVSPEEIETARDVLSRLRANLIRAGQELDRPERSLPDHPDRQ